MTATQTTVTRMEIKRHVEAAFRDGSPGPAQLIASAQASRAPAEVISVLERLNRGSYAQLRDLWTELRDIPVTAND